MIPVQGHNSKDSFAILFSFNYLQQFFFSLYFLVKSQLELSKSTVKMETSVQKPLKEIVCHGDVLPKSWRGNLNGNGHCTDISWIF